MSLPDRSPPRRFPNAAPLLAALALALAAASGCTVRPLYSDAGLPATDSTASIARPSIAVRPVTTRAAQEVRNHLIFALYGGSGEPAGAAQTLDLNVTALREPAALIQVGTEDEPTAGTITLIAAYTLTTTADGKQVARGRRQITASYDVPRQDFAAMRAERDAEDRAARELAQLLRLAIAQDLARLTQ